MAFPAEQLRVEIFTGGAWGEITSDVLGAGDIRIRRGRANETGKPVSSSMSLTLKDYGQGGGVVGKYSDRNPRSPYFGLIGKNTPIRVALRPGWTSGPAADVSDTFARTVAAGANWGTATSGQVYDSFTIGTGGTSSVGSGVGSHAVGAAASARADRLASVSMRSGELLVTGIAAPLATGGELEVAGVMYRGTGLSAYGMVRVHLTTGNAVQVRAYTAATGGGQIGSTYTSGITHTGTGQPLSLRVRLVGQQVWVKVWVTSGSEPAAYQAMFTDPAAVLSGWIGIRTGRGVGNTNSGTTASYDAFTFTNELCRFAGEVPAWKPTADKTGRSVQVPIEASGILRRLTASRKPVQSAIRRYVTTNNVPLSSLVGYWPMEEGFNAKVWASGKPGGPSIPVTSMVAVSNNSNPIASLPLPVLGSAPTAVTLSSSSATKIYFGALVSIPTGGLTSGSTMYAIDQNPPTGSTTRFDLQYIATSTFKVRALNSSGGVIAESSVGFVIDGITQIDGATFRLLVSLEDTGSNANWEIWVLNQDGRGSIASGTLTGARVGTPAKLTLNPSGTATNLAIGHIGIGTSSRDDVAFGPSLNGYAGEAADTRFARLCSENGVPYEVVGTAGAGRKMGPQRLGTLVRLLEDCETSEAGIVGDARDFLGLRFTSRGSLSGQATTAALSYTSAHLSEQLQPVDDDQGVINDLTAEDPVTGDTARYELTTGKNNVSDPEDDPNGIGRYNATVPISARTIAQLQEAAEWRVLASTVDEDRVPRLSVNLARDVFQASQTLMASVAAVDEGAIVSVADLPVWLPPETIVQMVRGYTETLANSERERGWSIEWNTSPGRFYQQVGVYDAASSRYDSDSSTLATGYNSTATSLSVATSDAADLWTTGATWFPFDIFVSGERITVTNITGTSSPQTFTVTRSVNGVVKSLPASAPVRLYVPPQSRYGL